MNAAELIKAYHNWHVWSCSWHLIKSNTDVSSTNNSTQKLIIAKISRKLFTTSFQSFSQMSPEIFWKFQASTHFASVDADWNVSFKAILEAISNDFGYSSMNHILSTFRDDDEVVCTIKIKAAA